MTSSKIPPLHRAVRLHQWAKHTLRLPALAAHLAWSRALDLARLGGCFAFSLVASGLYLVNDLLDLPHDRLLPSKSRRPVASGQLSGLLAAGAALVNLVVGLVLVACFRRPSWRIVMLAPPLIFAAHVGLVLTSGRAGGRFAGTVTQEGLLWAHLLAPLSIAWESLQRASFGLGRSGLGVPCRIAASVPRGSSWAAMATWGVPRSRWASSACCCWCS